MEENAFHGMAPPPPASPTPTSDDPSFQRYDVFINHRGPDVKTSLGSVLYQFLQYLGLKVFLDSTELQLGDSLSANIQDAISSCPVQIAIFSKGYASSPWCLAELDFMLKTEAKTGAKIVPLFYDVVPTDLRYLEKGAYAEAFTKYEEKGRYVNNLREWKQSLHRASFNTGKIFDSKNGDIVDTVLNGVIEARKKSLCKLEVAEHPVGLEEAIQELEAKISFCAENENRNGKIVGIVGKDGVGKTTLVKEFYNRKHTTVCRSSLLFDVGKAHADKIGKLQHKLMCDLRMPLPLSTSAFRPNGPKEGFGVEMIKSELERWYSKPLIILDGVDDVDQLEALAVNEFLKHGALVIVTCRHGSVLQSFEMAKVYEMRGLEPKYARHLFCWHAFRRSHPPSGREEFVEDILKVSGGLPLHLKKLGEGIYSMQNDIDAVV